MFMPSSSFASNPVPYRSWYDDLINRKLESLISHRDDMKLLFHVSLIDQLLDISVLSFQ